jgi:Ni,Fe-hydrogenase III large subunit/Ni,Fe-hydrogenase III component G
MKKFEPFIPKDAVVTIHGNVATFEVPHNAIEETVRDLLAKKLSLKTIDATDERTEGKGFRVWYAFGVPGENIFVVPFIRLLNTEVFPSVVHITQVASGYERKIQTMFGLHANGNCDGRKIILHEENWPDGVFPMRKDFAWDKRPEHVKSGEYQFQRVEGEGIYEIPVGPIHAGIIEPGHFRFSMAGESIMLLEGRLGYVHKGAEKLMEALPLGKKLALSERISGDSTVSHSLAFCQAVENLAGVKVPERAQYLRTIFAEMERIANHLGDCGALMMDTGYGFGAANGGRLREITMRLNEKYTGNRFMRGLNKIGGVTKDLTGAQAKELSKELDTLLADFLEVIEVAENSASMLNRMKSTGRLKRIIADDYGALGVPARAVGRDIDTRRDYPYAAYAELGFTEVHTEQDGDVYARFRMRVEEICTSVHLVQKALHTLPEGKVAAPAKSKFPASSIAISLVEGWRGEIVYIVMTDGVGNISRVVIRDPSFINWQVIGYCGDGNIVPDFPLINKSFNLSYTGNDL